MRGVVRKVLLLLRNLALLAVYLIVLAVLIDLAGKIDVLKQLNAYVMANSQRFMTIGFGLIAAGVLLALGVLLYGTLRYGRRSSRGSVSYDNSHSTAEVKAAFRNGAWLQDSSMRRFLLAWLGWVLLGCGFVTLFVAIGSATVQFMVEVQLLLVVVWVVWRFLRA